jgi:predicted MPP superfamily phosphohydrolase
VRRALLTLAGLIAAIGLFAGYCFLEARRDPVVRRANVRLADWPRGAPPVHVVLISDIHIGTPAMGPERLARIVGQVDALHPDLILIAGDFIYGRDPAGAARLGSAMIGPLSRLEAPLGTIAVLGNHDWWTGAPKVREQLARAHIRTLDNAAMTVGPLALGGVGDDFSGHANLPATLRAVRTLPGAHVLLTHSPDIAPDLPPDMPLLLAGHTHCGQVVLPFYGPISDVSQYHARYRCGVRREGSHAVIVTGGLGTSGGPFRFNAPPDLWLITLGPAQ